MARVFAAFVDLREAAKCLTQVREVEKLTSGPVGVGTVFRERRTLPNGTDSVQEFEIVVYVPEKSCTTFPALRVCGLRLFRHLMKSMA